VVYLEAVPEYGYRFVNWSGDIDEIDNVTSLSASITMNSSHNITANFESAEYTLSISTSGGGQVTHPAEAVSTYPAGTVVNLTANPNSNHKWINWTGDNATISNVYASSTDIFMNEDYEIVANFCVENRCILKVLSSAGGSVDYPGEGAFIFLPGTLVQLQATPEEGYRFDTWSGDISALNNINSTASSILMDADYIIMANFIAL
jgi:hypothetical protein